MRNTSSGSVCLRKFGQEYNSPEKIASICVFFGAECFCFRGYIQYRTKRFLSKRLDSLAIAEKTFLFVSCFVCANELEIASELLKMRLYLI